MKFTNYPIEEEQDDPFKYSSSFRNKSVDVGGVKFDH